jgi:hypothetical protein
MLHPAFVTLNRNNETLESVFVRRLEMARSSIMEYHMLSRLVAHRRCRSVVAYGLLLAFTAVYAHAGTALNATSMSADIEKRGAGTVFAELSQGERWDEFIRKVETGQTPWLQIVVQLRPASDQAAATLLTVAAGVALARAPRQVLSVVVPTLPVEEICGLPDVSDLRFDTKAKAIQYVDVRIAAVAELSQPSISDLKSACLKALKEARQVIAGPSGPFSLQVDDHRNRVIAAYQDVHQIGPGD